MQIEMRHRGIIVAVLFFLLSMMPQCASNPTSAKELPQDILGISVGMNKEDAQKRLEEIAEFESEGRKTGQLWRMKNDPHFKHIAVGYDADNRVRFVTAFVDKATAKERIRFTDVGDLKQAKQEIVAQHRRYIWEVPSIDGKPAYFVNIYGDEPEFVSHYSLSKVIAPKEKQE